MSFIGKDRIGPTRKRSSSGGGTNRGSMNKTESIDSGFEENIDFLFPNGILIQYKCDRNSTLGAVKSGLWNEVIERPGANHLRDSGHYVCIGVNVNAEEREFLDDMKMEDLKLLHPVLELSEPMCIRDRGRLTRIVGEAIGVPICEMDAFAAKLPELQTLRHELRKQCYKLATERQEWTLDRQAEFCFPPKFDVMDDLPINTATIIAKAVDNKIQLNVWIVEGEDTYTHCIMVQAQCLPINVIEATIAAICQDQGYSDEDIEAKIQNDRHMFVLKVAGKEEFMLSQKCIHKYKYIRTCINKGETPELHMTYKEHVYSRIPQNTCVALQQVEEKDKSKVKPGKIIEPEATSSPVEPPECIRSWDVCHESCYAIKLKSLPVKSNDYPNAVLHVEAQIFHGSQALCDPIRTLDKGWNQLWTFNIHIQALPRCARICMITRAVENGKTLSEGYGINWVNMQIFDDNGYLVTGEQSLGVWDFKLAKIKKTNPMGPSGSNPDQTAMPMIIEIPKCESVPIVYPPDSYIDEKIKQENKYTPPLRQSYEYLQELDKIIDKDCICPITDEDKIFLWRHRFLAMEYEPNILPKVAQCVDWKERHEVFEFYRILSMWPTDTITVTKALHLLGPDFPDLRLRKLAMRVLKRQLTSEQLELYLLQLTQVLKFESYLNNKLAKYLTSKALNNKNLGHQLFWHLRCEIHDPLAKVRFAPILEAYCMFSGSDVLDERLGDVSALKTFHDISKKSKQSAPEKETSVLQTFLNKDDTKKVLIDTPSVLDKTLELGEFVEDECKIMVSKMKPLWLTWKNSSKLAQEVGKEDVKYIVKNGDDLRQDMLIIQLLRVMDIVWKTQCRDYWMTTYECLAMGENIGMIEVVRNAQTMCTTHQKGSIFKTASTTHTWLYRSSTGTDIGYLEAVRRFTYSCAGYCVATYILGIGDRHSDNIMVKDTGELFHIDFGHFMNHPKHKYGIKRERTPFVFTDSFVRVITKAKEKPRETEEFKEFLYYCFEAFMAIRRQSDLFLTLLSLMAYCDLPELSDVMDINYCRTCLSLNKSEHEAGTRFMSKLFKSYEGQWKTNVDWFLHRFNKALKKSS